MNVKLRTIGLIIGSFSLLACANDSGESEIDSDGGVDAESDADSYVPPYGEPIEGVDFDWVWVDVPGSICRDGSSTGFAVNMNGASNKVML